MSYLRIVAGGCLILAGMSLGTARAESPPEKQGITVEILNQENQWIKLELREVAGAYSDPARLSFTKKLEPKMSQIAWFEIPVEPAKRKLNVREVRMADTGQKFKDSDDGREYLFYSVVIVPFDGLTASWYWQAASLSGVTRDRGAPKLLSIPLSDIKVVRFPKEPGT